MEKKELQIILNATRVPILLVATIWIIHLLNIAYDLSFHQYGLYPKDWKGLVGVITSPLIHDSNNFEHILNNSLPIAVLVWTLFYFYKELAFRVLFQIWIMGGTWVWIFAVKEGIPHIGISGVIYGLAGFIFTSGIIRRDKNLLAISMLVTFLYGSLVWGIFPYKEHMSWEGHLWGGVAGVVLAFYYRQKGPQIKKYRFEIREELEQQLEAIHTIQKQQGTLHTPVPFKVAYHYRISQEVKK